MRKIDSKILLVGAALLGFISLSYISYITVPSFLPLEYNPAGTTEGSVIDVAVAAHLSTPEFVRAIYMTSWVAGTPKWRADLVQLIEKTELNAVVIDIKDSSGRISFEVTHPDLVATGAQEKRIPDVREFIADLHEKGIYVIGRISVFQDPHFVLRRPDLAVKRMSDREIWKDYKGLPFLDPGSREVWDYIVVLARESYNVGFDELNFDYIRFPSDGNMNDMYYPFSEERIVADPDYGKAEVLREFFAYLNDQLSDVPVLLSADLFGMVTTNTDDLNVGQVLEYAEPYFDYISPMVYPSHYPKWFIGLENPAALPYDVVRFSMERAVERLLAASSTPEKLRPWLQDFDLGAIYDAGMVRAQMQAVYDAGLDSWMLWDAANKYTRGALLEDN